MNRQAWLFLLATALLLAVLLGLSYAQSPSQEPAVLSVTVLRPEEGNAVIAACGGQTLLLPLGDGSDGEALAEYLRRQPHLQIEQLVWVEQTPIPAAWEKHLADADRMLLQDEALILPLGDAVCRVERAADALTLTVTHAGNRLQLRFSPELPPELTLNAQAPTVLETARHSVRIFSDGAAFSLRPDFSAWED